MSKEGFFEGRYCVGTLSGLYVDFQHPDPDDIDIQDIANSLSRMPRFNGHVRIQYSVLEHSFLVYDLLARGHVGSDHNLDTLFAGLLHDASEAYTGDMPGPLKALLTKNCRDFKLIEGRLTGCIYEKYGIDYGEINQASVKLADQVALRLEAKALCHNRGDDWNWSSEVDRLADSAPGYLHPVGFARQQCIDKFMSRFWDLTARKQRVS
jgi:hypothetical protein